MQAADASITRLAGCEDARKVSSTFWTECM